MKKKSLVIIVVVLLALGITIAIFGKKSSSRKIEIDFAKLGLDDSVSRQISVEQKEDQAKANSVFPDYQRVRDHLIRNGFSLPAQLKDRASLSLSRQVGNVYYIDLTIDGIKVDNAQWVLRDSQGRLETVSGGMGNLNGFNLHHFPIENIYKIQKQIEELLKSQGSKQWKIDEPKFSWSYLDSSQRWIPRAVFGVNWVDHFGNRQNQNWLYDVENEIEIKTVRRTRDWKLKTKRPNPQ